MELTAKEKQLIEQTAAFVRERLRNNEAGHDYWHTVRVWKTADYIARKENISRFAVSLGALLHDIADAKFNGGNEEEGPAVAASFLRKIKVDEETVSKVVHIVRYVSFKNRYEAEGEITPELAAVQDADRLDALGAIGIARTFNYGGFKNRPLYNPDIKPVVHTGKDSYKKSTAPTINHFYEKLLLLKDLMNTGTGKKLAEKRHRFMERFLEEFFKEWNMDFDES